MANRRLELLSFALLAACTANPTSDAGPSDGAARDAGRDAERELRMCAGDDECESGEVCDYAPPRCEESWGYCVRGAVGCEGESALGPVCGCDMVTYDRDCDRAMAGVTRFTEGACPEPGGMPCDQLFPCPSGYYCETEFCGIMAGECHRVPSASECPPIWAPVCGCDGARYENDCHRRAAGVAASGSGILGCIDTCRLEPRLGCCFGHLDCTDFSRCVGAVCEAGGEGRCVSGEPPDGQCWDETDCRWEAGERCEGATVCPCGELCDRPTSPGACVGGT